MTLEVVADAATVSRVILPVKKAGEYKWYNPLAFQIRLREKA